MNRVGSPYKRGNQNVKWQDRSNENMENTQKSK